MAEPEKISEETLLKVLGLRTPGHRVQGKDNLYKCLARTEDGRCTSHVTRANSNYIHNILERPEFRTITDYNLGWLALGALCTPHRDEWWKELKDEWVVLARKNGFMGKALQTELEESREKLQEAQTENRKLREELEALKADSKAGDCPSEEQNSKLLEELDTQNKEYEIEKLELEAQIKNLRQELDALKQPSSVREPEVESQVNDLTTERDKFRKLSMMRHAEILRHREKVSERERSTRMGISSYKQLEVMVQRLEEENTRLCAQQMLKATQLESAAEEKTSCRTMILRQEELNTTLHHRINELETTCAQQRTAMETLLSSMSIASAIFQGRQPCCSKQTEKQS